MNRVNRRITVIIHDLMMVGIAWCAAFLIRYNMAIPEVVWQQFYTSLPVVVFIQGVVLWWTGLYRGLWRFASIPDLWNIFRAVSLGVVAVGLALFIYNRLEGVPRSSLLIYPLLLIFLLGAPRMIYRLWKDHSLNLQQLSHGAAQRVLILGAGSAAEMLARDMKRDSGYQAIGFLDDNRQLKGAKVQGLLVLGDLDQLAQVVEDRAIDLVVIAMPSADNSQMQRVVELCERLDISFRTLPRVEDLVSGKVGLDALRQVAIDDLLGRDPVSLDWQYISRATAGKTVFVTGGGGSIGSELCRQIAPLGPSRLVILEQSEFSLYRVEMELRQKFPNLLLQVHLVDICDADVVDHLMETYCPDVIFHAAAYKHVPMLEEQAREAVRNNVLGTRTIALAADRHQCGSFVMVSTDKAVNPANVMGASKRAAEIFCQTLNCHSRTHYITVRFGNVLGSAGSVVPLFREQIESGGPVTVTHPDITRFFMTIPEASQLIMQAAAMGEGGEIFVLDMGKPVRVNYLAEQMIRLSGKMPGRDIKISYTGLRPGEKLYEELFHDQESLVKTGHEKILLAQSRKADWEQTNEMMEAMERACRDCSDQQAKALLKQLVPEMGAVGVEIKDNVVPLTSAVS